jgi:hypothetical protein
MKRETLERRVAWFFCKLVLTASGAAVPVATHAATFLVGGDVCDFSTIQPALDAAASNPGPDAIHVAMNATYTAQALEINNQELTITGGFATCGSTAPTPGARTIISGLGGASDSVIEVLTSTAGNLRFENLLIRDGDESGDSGGGGIDFQSQGTLTLNNVIVADNRSGYGGGILFEGANGPATLTFGPDTVIQNNVAENSGGGVRVSGNALFNMLRERTTVTNNEALGQAADTGYGGGVQIVPPARAEIASPGFVNFGAISGNRAKYGGGLALTARDDGNQVGLAVLYSVDPLRPVRVDHNIASVAGGGIYLDTNRDITATEITFLCAYEFRIDHNQAPDGAALFVASEFSLGLAAGALVDFNLADSQTAFRCGVSALPPRPSAVFCAPGVPCNSLDGNVVALANGQAADGAVVEAAEGTQLRVDRIAIVGNNASDAIHTFTADAIDLSNVLIADNVLTARAIASDARVNFLNLTIAGNTQGFGDVMRLTNSILLRDSIIWQPGKQALGGPHGTLDGFNVLTNDPASLPIPGAFNLDPRFIDPGRGDYRLRAASPAIDAANPESDPLDLDALPRHQDLPVPNGFGPRDLGAYERPSVDPLVINGDFLTDIALWDVVTPGVSNFDPGENAAGVSEGGSMSFDFVQQPVIAGRVESRAQCVHLPLPGTYRPSAFARTTGSLPTSAQFAVLHWELRRDGGESCSGGPPDAQGDIRITSGSAWVSSGTPAAIFIAPGEFTRNSSIRISTVMETTAPVPRRLTGWFDRFRLTLSTNELFKDSFE